ncbi:hypothetical protein TanjilG_12897 [Lupinus angustifolius]|uniref:Uncharacterized protein n=1 Tax=Lupinus angustifolius TaxID=3871 RepID=A0A1J7HHZ8_LUPAN|nr:hypothetical protein TanjilG_12897 [Lupinus angustifolius]
MLIETFECTKYLRVNNQFICSSFVYMMMDIEPHLDLMYANYTFVDVTFIATIEDGTR